MRKPHPIKDAYRAVFPDYAAELAKELRGCSSVLDIACGANSPLGRVKKSFRSVGVDLHEKSLERSRAAGIHDEYHRMDALQVGKRFKPRSFDAVIAIDLIEHLEKGDGYRLIAMMERLARKKVIIFTPNGFLPQGEYDENPWQVHRSGWEVDEMARAGYRVVGINGWKPLRGEYAEIRFRPKYLFLVLSDITQHVTKHVPETAFQLLCIKDMQKWKRGR